MFAVFQLPHFPLQALLRMKPEWRGEPVGMLEGEGRHATVCDVTPAALNVSPGMTAAQALAACPALQLMTACLASEREACSLLRNAGWALSPRVELARAGLCTVDVSGVARDRLPGQIAQVRARLVRDGFTVKVGVAANPRLARFAAAAAEREIWVDDPRAFLQPLPLSYLDLMEGEARLFGDLGIRTLGALTAFPRASLVNRLGARGDDLWRQAAGEDTRPIDPVPLPIRHLATMEWEEAVETLDPLLFVLRRFCERLAAEVGQFGGGTARLALRLALENDQGHARDFELPEPTANPDVLFGVLEHHLSSLTTEAAIVGLSLEVFPARRVEQQEGLFDTGLRDAPMFYATLGRIAAIIGAENIGTPRHADSHRPDSVKLAPPAAAIPERKAPDRPDAFGPILRRLRPPVPATVELSHARPSYILSSVAQGDVTLLRRPVWLNGDWWMPEKFTREEWDVQVGTGLYRLLHEPEGWFIDGIYD